MRFWQRSPSEMVNAWNNMVGFEHLKSEDLVFDSLEEWVNKNLPDVHMTQVSELGEHPHDFFLLLVELMQQASFNILTEDLPPRFIISVARNSIITPHGIDNIDNLGNYNILDGFRISYDVWDIGQFCDSFTQRETIRLTQHLVHLNNHTMYFTCERVTEIHYVSIPGNTKCFRLGLDFTTHESHLFSLFYDVKKMFCYNLPSRRIGTWFLEFVDAVNLHTNMFTCELTDESELGGYPAACSYSLNHHGLSWYMSHKFVVESHTEKSVNACVEATNWHLQRSVDYWNDIRRTNNMSDELLLQTYCDNFPLPTPNMIKFYSVNIHLHVPQDLAEAAHFSVIPEEFTLFRAKDVMHVMQCENDAFVVSQGFREACRLKCSSDPDGISEWLLNAPIDKYRLEQYYRALFPVLQACHTRTRQQRRSRDRDPEPGECHTLDCRLNSDSALSCMEFCREHFEDSINKLMEATRIISISNANIEIPALVKRYYLSYCPQDQYRVDAAPQHLKGPLLKNRNTSPDTILVDLQENKTARLGAQYEFELFVENVKSVTGYFQGQQVELGNDFVFEKRSKLLTIEFGVTQI
jgi:hypothetical protein